MGTWTKQPGDVSLYAAIRRDAITVSRIDQLAAYAGNELGRTVTRQQVVKWLRKFAAFIGERDAAEWVLFEMPEAQVANLPPLFADQFGTAAELADHANISVDQLNDLLGTAEAGL